MIETNFIDTEIGCVPADWAVIELKNLIVYLRTGLNPRSNFKLNTTDARGYYVTVRELKGYDIVVDENTDRVNDDALLCIDGRAKLKVNDILFSGTGTIGQTAIVKKLPYKWGIKEGIYAITVDEKKLSPLFLLLYLHTPLAISLFDLYASGSTIRSVPMSKMERLPVPLPPLPEQRRIASALSSIDNLISALDKLIEKKCAIKTGTMQELLGGKRRVKGCEGEWKSVSIDEICNRLDNLRIPISEVNRKHGTTPYYGANGIQDYVEGFTHNGEYILLAEDGANSLVDYPIRYVSGKIWVNNHAHVLQAKEMRADNKFLSYAFKNVDFESNIVGCGRAKLNSQTLMQLKIVIPSSLSEQRAIASVLTAMDDELAALEAKKAKYVALKQGMMQQLLTGKIRLIDSSAK